MFEAIILAIAGALVSLLAPRAWKRSAELIRRARGAVRREYRMWRLRRGKYVAHLTVAEYERLVKDPGLDALHPQLRAEVDRALRAMAERRWNAWMPRRSGWLRSRARRSSW